MHDTFVETFNEMLPEDQAILQNLAGRHTKLIQDIDRAFIEMTSQEIDLLKSFIGRSLEKELFRERRKSNTAPRAYA